MSEVRVRSVEEIISGLVPKFISDARYKISELKKVVDLLRNPDHQGEAVNRFLRDVHSIKGVAGSFGFSFVAVVCHKLEDYIINTPVFTRVETDEIMVFFYEIECILRRGGDPNDDESYNIFRRLPTYVDFDKYVETPRLIETLFIGPRDVQFLIIEKQLANCGIRTTNIAKSLQGVELAVRTRPDFIMVSNVIDSISGPEVIGILSSINSIKKIPIMFIVSAIDLEDKKKKITDCLPPRVKIVRKGFDFPDDFASALVTLDIL